jgi:LPS sulfotransferase NodH
VPRRIRTQRTRSRSTQFTKAFPDGHVIRRDFVERLAASRRLYIIFIVARSGSTWLMDLADRASLGKPHEWFNEHLVHAADPVLGPRLAFVETDVQEYITKVMAECASDTAMGIEISHLQARLALDLLEAPLPEGVVFFYLRRRNILAQAISFYRSVTSGIFHLYDSEPEKVSDLDAVPYDPDGIAFAARELMNTEIGFERLFRAASIRPRRFFYEDIVADPHGVIEWMARELNVVPQPRSAPDAPTSLRLAGNQSREWEQRLRAKYQDELDAMVQSRPPLLTDFEPVAHGSAAIVPESTEPLRM